MAGEIIDEERVSMEEELDGGNGDVILEESLGEENVEMQGQDFVDTAVADAAGEAAGNSEINVDTFTELILPDETVAEVQRTWQMLINQLGSGDAVGDAMYVAVFETSGPAIRPLFVTPRAVEALRIFTQVNQMINNLSNPNDLKNQVEQSGFWHLQMPVTVPRCIVFRDAIVDIFVAELGSKLTSTAAAGLTALLNYFAGAMVYCKTNFAGRLQCLAESWAIANDTGANADKFATMGSIEVAEKGDHETANEDAKVTEGDSKEKSASLMDQNIPKTYKEMFQFNAAVMGFGTSLWMNEVLAQFNNLVENVTNSARLEEEAAILVLRIAKVTSSKVNLAEYKSCMLASLRSLLPKDWSTQHEVAWCWLWENVEKLMLKDMGKTDAWSRALDAAYESLDEAAWYQLRADFYAKFFVDCPQGEGYFKQSNTYLHIIAQKMCVLFQQIYKEPVETVDAVSSLGLRHVGYAIPTELFPPLVTVFLAVVKALGVSDTTNEAFSWAINLVAKMQTRTIIEGTTVVMKAINANSSKMFQRSISFAPRGERSKWVLLITAGTQEISPFFWAIQSGALDAAEGILADLTTIRADRERYYYGVDDLFKRHPDMVKILLDDAPKMIPQLLDGLIWRSRVAIQGYRRVNYYIKNLLLDPQGKFHKTLEWINDAQDPKTVCLPVLVLLADLVWARVACRSFLVRKSWFIITLFVFLTSQSALHSVEPNDITRAVTFGFRIFIYLFSMGIMIFSHIGRIVKAYRTDDLATLFGKVKFPKYLENWQDSFNFVLMLCLIIMLASDPILHCLDDNGGKMFSQHCSASKEIKFFPYSVFTMIAMVLYYLLIIDLAVFSNRVSAYVLVCGRMLLELALFLLALSLVLLMLSSGFSCLEQPDPHFQTIGKGFLALWEMMLGMYSPADYETLHKELVLLVGCYFFLVVGYLFLLNLLIAQLCCSYDSIYDDMVGFARLKRIKIIADSMPSVSPSRWQRFVDSLELNKRLEFNEGDVGLAGGVQILEPASQNPTSIDSIRRFGGSTSPSIKWPEETGSGDEDADKFGRIEDLLKKLGEQASKVGASTASKGPKAGSSAMGSGSGGVGAGSQEIVEGEEVVEEEVEGGVAVDE